jgi:LCP family protein required for cell wall assembly
MPPGPPPTGTERPGSNQGPSPRRIRGTFKGILLGCTIVLACAIAGGAVAVLDEVQTLRDALSINGSLRISPGALAGVGWGQPQTILLVGDDQRSLTKYYHVAVPHLANEMLLVRLDPSKPYISMMSIPRELWVPIHPPGRQPYVNRINSAYTYGIGTLVQTLKQDLGLSVNHVIVITFGRFKRAVDEMGCVYSTVDRRYFHINVPGGPQYQEINLQPGYQKMCGDQALQFVSYRHDDTSVIRDARDQSFLMDVKKQYGPTLASNVHKFETIFGQAVQTDPGLQSTTGILDLLGTLISASGRRVRQVPFQANLGPTFDTATPQQIAASVHAFLYGGSPIPRQATAAVARAVHSRRTAARLPLVAVAPGQLARARALASNLPFPLEYPRVQDRGGASVPPVLRGYLIHAPDGSAYPIYVAVFYAGQLGNYYDVQGTTWTTAPIFQSPDQTVTVGGRTYSLYYEGSHLRLVSWFEHGAAYWVRNSLTDALGNGEMLAIAEQTRPFTAATAPGRAPVFLRAAGIPAPEPKVQRASKLKLAGSLGGLVTLILVPFLGIALLRHRRRLAAPRVQLAAGLPAGARLSSALAHVPYVPLPPTPMSARELEQRRLAQRRTQRQRLVGGVVAAVAAAGVGAFVVISGASGSGTRRAHARTIVITHPTVPVSVLNASGVTGAAARLAHQLKADRVEIGTVGNETEPRPPGVEVMYAPGERQQALLLAHLLEGSAPTVLPIDPATIAAAGYGAKLVVVIG